jgi:enoyl-CoA hydratase/carnithine racemase
MAQEILIVDRHGNYASLTLNRPERRNALNAQLIEEMDRALASLEEDASICALLIKGAGATFCSGIDLREVERMKNPHSPLGIQRLLARLEKFPVPTIAAIQGAALAGGLELALHCDLRIAADNARLGMTVARVGLVVPFELTRKLIQAIGAGGAAEILFTGEPVGAQRAYEMGMVHEVVDAAALDSAISSWIKKIAGNAPLSLRVIKANIRRCMSAAFAAEHKDLDEMARQVRSSEDAKEGVRAFLEKRKPVWRAR